ncbi:MAG TPA: 2-polyprenyl-3-methyl-6-methoxy-1,4-benzoquinone monooxygenase [Aquabacterium sp.]|uniref:2-polyprenyl-3-methyl-6-methoxy-1,4-benzoquinone monooxygenase n=1 Tax=Aquabacterium sp. TaxID=1872578 RepID=UPI002E3767A6|nr:2-polyprenyl-3-methyl-6-methoxy-1,4-benzoquinone monooxygenase [Aquabacterium sp.]HEX5355763.1 2-polyprenyl-3-methyl-6-methoxy-1,4-benzoquinone monooxygenase [Aquabacterium sp.]
MNAPSSTSSSAIRHDGMDRLLMSFDTALRTVFAEHTAARPCPQAAAEGTTLSAEEKRLSAALMRVNHVGEVCAQALYASQAWGTDSPVLKAQFDAAAREETDHLAWTEQRLKELGSRTSLLNPLWYAGAFGIGLLAAKAGDKISLGFVVETERQVEHHLNSHMDRLPAGDQASKAIVAQMRDDEVAHANAALQAGGVELPKPVRGLMKLAAKVMTTAAHHI